ncbi:hypothetical protein A5740_23190 [Mycobacterium sp. GA-1841]|uniref:SDR family NAD(P)-dependent oxidoreductase n=1 Tax=Mycobacterium sp. GA-1841 TaxID=1834154 RepID=UPI00096C5B39|nr:SDR family oxidoreductase [Mycobacterium sp. GA-1841]OMC41376.1 hypothetical protein A5740_23190 [Mycobacterium sp. GA-1841]
MTGRKRVVVVTGGGGGIGAAVARALGRAGDFVVTLDPLVSLDGAQTLPVPEFTSADQIIADGGDARTSDVSVTDAAALRALFAELADEFGGLDAVVNSAGISRPTSYTTGSTRDWQDVLDVHLDGYLNVLRAAMPLMATAGRGHILGVTSGSGWRAADTGAYGCAKRAVAALTWQIGRQAPDGVFVNAISPIAATRMVASAQRSANSTSTTGGLSLAAMPDPDDLGALAAHLVADDFTACRGRVLFTAGSEVAVVDEPRLIEVVRHPGVPLDAAAKIALGPAETRQVTGGGSNRRFGGVRGDDSPTVASQLCAVITESPAAASAITRALQDRAVTAISMTDPASLTTVADLDAVVVTSSTSPVMEPSGWRRTLHEHADTATQIAADAGWSRAVAELAAHRRNPLRLVTVHDATTAAGRTRAQAACQLARAGRTATDGRVLHFAVSNESGSVPAEVVAHLVCSPQADDLAGAELVAGAGWFGLRGHPRPIGSLSIASPDLPPWFDAVLREMVPQ